MIRIGALIWSLLVSLIVTTLGLFYNHDGKNGYPLSITRTLENGSVEFNWGLFAADAVFWWILFSILLVVVKNYVLDDMSNPKEKEVEQKEIER